MPEIDKLLNLSPSPIPAQNRLDIQQRRDRRKVTNPNHGPALNPSYDAAPGRFPHPTLVQIHHGYEKSIGKRHLATRSLDSKRHQGQTGLESPASGSLVHLCPTHPIGSEPVSGRRPTSYVYSFVFKAPFQGVKSLPGFCQPHNDSAIFV